MLAKFLPSFAFAVIMLTAASLSASVGLQMVRSPSVIVWYEGQIDSSQAQAIADDASKQWTGGHTERKFETLEIRLLRERANTSVTIDKLRLDALTPQMNNVFNEFGHSIVKSTFMSDTVTVYGADGKGKHLVLTQSASPLR